MEDPIYGMYEEEDNEPESFEGFIDNRIYVMSKRGSIESLDNFIEDPIYEVFREDSMDFKALGNLCMGKSMQLVHMISLSDILVAVMKT